MFLFVVYRLQALCFQASLRFCDWFNHASNYIWDFRGKNDEGNLLIVVSDPPRPTPVTWNIFYTIEYINDDNIFIKLWFSNGVTQHRIKFISDNVLEFQNPPVDNAGNAPVELITLRKA